MTDTATPGYVHAADKDPLIKRMHRIEGQVRGIEKMIDGDRYCIDILTQIAAVDTALEAVAFKILADHVNHCVAHALASGDEAVAAEKISELLQAVHRFARTRRHCSGESRHESFRSPGRDARRIPLQNGGFSASMTESSHLDSSQVSLGAGGRCRVAFDPPRLAVQRASHVARPGRRYQSQCAPR